jgi:hypothetical protein
MGKKKPEANGQALPDGLVTFTVRLSPSLIKRAKLAATLLETPVQMVVSDALHKWLSKHETVDQGKLLIYYAKKMAAKKEDM